MCIRSAVLIAVSLVLSLVAAAPALAAPPTNDNRDGVVALALPQTVTGTTIDATLEAGEPRDSCDTNAKGSVWYRITGVRGRIALTLQADGDLDASVAVFQLARSQATQLDCGQTDLNGLGVAAFSAEATGEYLIRVAERSYSLAGTFTLKTLRASDEAEAPGRTLPSGGVSDSLNFATNRNDAWSVRLSAGVTYRVNLATDSESYCIRARMEHGKDVAKQLSCSTGYTLFTPRAGEGGLYTIFVETATRLAASQRYRLQIGRAGTDDTGPGQYWGGGTLHGRIDGDRLDVSDLFNWDLSRRSEVELRVSGGFDLQLLSSRGRVLADSGDGEPIERRLAKGQYFVVVSTDSEQSGGYTLKRTVRAITSTKVAFNGRRGAVVSPGRRVTVTGRVKPTVSGRIELIIDRYDPVFGWQFFKQARGSARSGAFSTSFVAPGIGSLRAKAFYKGSRSANRSSSGFARLKIER